MNIGKVSQASGVSTKMIRYYEQIGLIPTAGRNNAGYRSYSSTDVERSKFIKRSRELGFSVVEISDLLDLWNDRNRQSADVKRLALGHIEKLEERINDLQQMANTLKDLINCCAGDDRPDRFCCNPGQKKKCLRQGILQSACRMHIYFQP